MTPATTNETGTTGANPDAGTSACLGRCGLGRSRGGTGATPGGRGAARAGSSRGAAGLGAGTGAGASIGPARAAVCAGVVLAESAAPHPTQKRADSVSASSPQLAQRAGTSQQWHQ